MSYLSILTIAFSLAMDAFAVAMGKGLAMKRLNTKKAFIIGLYFGFFQALMPIIGYFTGQSFYHVISAYDHWIVFILLGLIGANMIKEGFEGEDTMDDSTDFKTMLLLAIATSIDALAAGISFTFMAISIWPTVLTIGILTALLSVLGVAIGHVSGTHLSRYAQFLGGAILICMGTHTLLSHLGILG